MMEERAHALLSASGAKRWMSCPPSARLEDNFAESKSEYADEGSFAHTYAELLLTSTLKLITKKEFKKQATLLMTDSFYSSALEEYVQVYVTIVIERLSEAKKRSKDAVMFIEQKLDFSRWVTEGFGTGDAVIIADGILEIIDLKYGKGVPVSAESNPQLKLYGLGALDAFEMLYDVNTVRMTIVQPRLDSISSESILVDDLYAWAESEVVPKAALAFAGEGDFCAGDHCRFCRAKAQCRKRAEANLELAKHDFAEPALLSDDEIADVLTKAEQLQSWAGDIQAYALDQAWNNGKKWPGWKLVEGRSNRAYTNREEVASVLLLEGYEEDKIYEPRAIKGVTAMEKEIGKKVFAEVLKDYIVKPAGRPTLVPESDKRSEINSLQSAIDDFLE